MTEYESATPFYFTVSSRRWSYAMCAFWALLTMVSSAKFGGDVWLTRLFQYGFMIAFSFVLWSFVSLAHQSILKRSRFEHVSIGEKNFFTRSDRDPEDPRLI